MSNFETIWPEATWTQDELGKRFPDAKNLKDLIQATTQLAREHGVVVCEVNVNGLALSEEQEDRFQESPISEVQTLKIRTERIETLLDESLVGCQEFLTRVMGAIEHASQLFRAEDLVAAHRFYQSCIEGTQLFIDMITHYKVVFQASRGNLPASWNQVEVSILKTLGVVLDAYKKKNYILVADLLEYDLINVLVQWQKELINIEGRQRIPSNTEGPTAESAHR